MVLEDRVDVLEEKVTTLQIEFAKQTASNAHTAANLSKMSDVLDRLIESGLLKRPPIDPILERIDTSLNIIAENQKPLTILDFVSKNYKLLITIASTCVGFGAWAAIHHFIS